MASRAASLGREVAFLIVGTPRSGTTLIRRLACELPGVRVPRETHFFREFVPARLLDTPFPLEGEPLRAVLRAYASLEVGQRLGIDADAIADAVADDVGDRCESPMKLFDAVVRHLAGPAIVYGEKTPDHAFWWRAVTSARPTMKLVWMIRDPRDVAASHTEQSWGMQPRVVAERWLFDARQVRTASGSLGPDRCLVFRCEDVVADPDAARDRLRSFLGLDGIDVTDGRLTRFPRELFLPAGRATEPVTGDTVDAWREKLSADQSAFLAARCRSEMLRFGYTDDVPGVVAALARLSRSRPDDIRTAVVVHRRFREAVRFAEASALNADASE